MSGPRSLRSVQIDEASLAPLSREVQHEREVAIFDLLEANSFHPHEAPDGPYDLALSLVDGRLAFDIGAEGFERRHLLSLTALPLGHQRLFPDLRQLSPRHPQRLAHPDRGDRHGRRGLHNEGSKLLMERLEGKVEVDLDTARRLFTLICALYRRT